MKRVMVTFIFVVMAASISFAADKQRDHLKARSDAWQSLLERESFHFEEKDASMLWSLSQFRAKCQIEMLYDPARWWSITFKFVRDGKTLISIDGHMGSVFCANNGILYFVQYSTATMGCMVTAHDLSNGAKLWEREMQVLGQLSHSAYSNHVTIGLSSLGEATETGTEGTIVITGTESYGDYVAVLDRATGQILASKIYRQAFSGVQGTKAATRP